MDSNAQLRAIAELLDRLEVEVRQAHLGGNGGGLCQIRDRRIVFVDLDADIATRVECGLRAAASLTELESTYLPAWMREAIDGLNE